MLFLASVIRAVAWKNLEYDFVKLSPRRTWLEAGNKLPARKIHISCLWFCCAIPVAAEWVCSQVHCAIHKFIQSDATIRSVAFMDERKARAMRIYSTILVDPCALCVQFYDFEHELISIQHIAMKIQLFIHHQLHNSAACIYEYWTPYAPHTHARIGARMQFVWIIHSISITVDLRHRQTDLRQIILWFEFPRQRRDVKSDVKVMALANGNVS